MLEFFNNIGYIEIGIALLVAIFIIWRFIVRVRYRIEQKKPVSNPIPKDKDKEDDHDAERHHLADEERHLEELQSEKEKQRHYEQKKRIRDHLERDELHRHEAVLDRLREDLQSEKEKQRHYEQKKRLREHLELGKLHCHEAVLDSLRRERRNINSQRREEEKQPYDESVRFHALWHRHMRPQAWQTLLVYIFSGSNGLLGARSDFMSRKTAPADSYDNSSSISRQHILHGNQISVYPELNGVRFNPPFVNVHWLEDWHCVEFRMQAMKPFEPTEGRVGFYVGPILIGETGLYAIATDEAHTTYQLESQADDIFWSESGNSPYRAIFVSYSHEDAYIIDRLELAYRALGDEYLRDIAILRSGEQWSPALLEKIKQANIFQLCWSESAKRSQYIEDEWHYALHLRRPNFIRPMYWEIPMPTPPDELSDIHFAYIRF